MRKIKVPDSIKIGGHKYKIILDGSKKMVDEAINGEVNYRKQQIFINATRPDSQRQEALLHEILHCADRTYGEGNISETVLCSLSEGLNQAFNELGIELKWRDIKRSK